MVPVKNHGFFLNAVKKLLGITTRKVKVFIVGDGEERKHIEEHAKRLQIDFTTEKDIEHLKSMVFTSWIKNVDEVASGLDIVALTSLNEGTPVSLIEAQAANRPVVSTRVGGIEDIVQENVSAFLTDKTDVSLFAENLKKLVEDDSLRNEMGNKGGYQVRQAYSYKRLISDMSHLYTELLSGI